MCSRQCAAQQVVCRPGGIHSPAAAACEAAPGDVQLGSQGYRDDAGLVLESDTDEQLLIHIPFQNGEHPHLSPHSPPSGLARILVCSIYAPPFVSKPKCDQRSNVLHDEFLLVSAALCRPSLLGIMLFCLHAFPSFRSMQSNPTRLRSSLQR